MKHKILISVVVGLVLSLAVVAVVTASRVGAQSRAPDAALGTTFTYQGQLTDDGGPVTDDCDMAFRLYDQAADGSQEGEAVTATVPITDGLFTAQLDFGAAPFDGDALWLGILVSCPGDAAWTDLGRQELTAAPYALYALGVPWTGISDPPAGLNDGDNDTKYTAGAGLDLTDTQFSVNTGTIQQRVASCPLNSAIRVINDDGSVMCDTDNDTQFQLGNVIFVAKSGGDFTSIQDAVDSAKDATDKNPYLVWVAPGIYEEQVTLLPHVHLQGAGQDVTTIASAVGNGGTWPTTATVVLTRNVSVRDLTIFNGGNSARNAALMAGEGTTQTVVSDVTARASGSGTVHYALYVEGAGTHVTFDDVTAVAEDCDQHCSSALFRAGAHVTLHGGRFIAREAGGSAQAIRCRNPESGLDAEAITVLAEYGTDANTAFDNFHCAVTLRGASITARGEYALGIENFGDFAYLDAEGVTVLAEYSGDTDEVAGLYNTDGADAIVRGGSFTARGGDDAYGIHSTGSGTMLVAEGVIAVGEDCQDDCYGLYHRTSADASLIGGSFTGRNGADAMGIFNDGAAALSLISQSHLEGADDTIDITAGTVTVTNSSLVGGGASSSADCLLVTRGANVSTNVSPYPCP